MHDPHLRHKVLGGLGAAALLLMFVNAFMLGGNSAESRTSQMKELTQSVRGRLQSCKREALRREAGHSTKENRTRGAERSIEWENHILQALVQDVMEVVADCERGVDEMKRRLVDGADDVHKVLGRLRYENAQLKTTKNEIITKKKEMAEAQRKSVRALKLENQELRNRYLEYAAEEEKQKRAAAAREEERLVAEAQALEQEAKRQQEKEAEERHSREKAAKEARSSGVEDASEEAAHTRRHKAKGSPSRRKRSDDNDGSDGETEERVVRRRSTRSKAKKVVEVDESDDDAPPPPPGKKKCEDARNDCAAWAADGECEQNPAFMKKRCRKSCKLC
eukprot:Rhum_TRINITY_DN18504_c0_g1::Rhum_TRINITY_DN18504_c0_g1_i1::g.167468::m.167468